jgi:hypothetical protein
MYKAAEKQHRYLQNEAIWILLRFIVSYADTGYDGRNESAVHACGMVREALSQYFYEADYAEAIIQKQKEKVNGKNVRN